MVSEKWLEESKSGFTHEVDRINAPDLVDHDDGPQDAHPLGIKSKARNQNIKTERKRGLYNKHH